MKKTKFIFYLCFVVFLFSNLPPGDVILSGLKNNCLTFQEQKNGDITNLKTVQKRKNKVEDVNIEKLKKSDWFGIITKDINHREYQVKYNQEDHNYKSYNRANNIWTCYNDSGFSLKPANDSAVKWDLKLQLTGIDKGCDPISNGSYVQRMLNDDSLIMKSNSYEVQYINAPDGIRENFTVQQKPEGVDSLKLTLNWSGDIEELGCDGNEVQFGKDHKIIANYSGLKVWDAKGRILAAKMSIDKENKNLALVINDKDAEYPVTVDPLASTAAWTKAGAAGSYYGWSIASAGDVNGDGISDIIVGAYNNGSGNGIAYLYLGSSTGPSTIASWSKTEGSSAQYGYAVASAGDVNGDGYSDIMVSAPAYNSSDGKVYLYFGSSSGPVSTASWNNTEGLGSKYGTSLAGVGDVNGDGYSDIIIGAPLDNSSAGKAYVYYGSSSGTASSASWTATGNPGSNYGFSVSAAGDVNGDGYSDVIVGAYSDGTNNGIAYVYSGSNTGLNTSPLWNNTEGSGSYYGYSVSCAGDVNGDGYSDIIVGAYLDNSSAGKVYVYYGSSSGPVTTASWANTGNAGSGYGWDVGGAGDINGDGYSDVIIGANTDGGGNGAAYLYTGSATGLALTATWTRTEGSGSNYGSCVASAGDVNGDGYSDIIIGAPGDNSFAGKSYLYYGSPDGPTTTEVWNYVGNAGSHYGFSMAGAGDVNGDGYSDIIVGAYYNSSGTGMAFLYFGSATGPGLSASWSKTEGVSSSYYGYSVAGAGDVNGDGYADIIVGAHNNGGGNGKAYLYFGSASGPVSTASWSKTEGTGSHYGNCVASAGDVNGDGYGDIIVGANKDGSQTGKAYVYYGSSTGPSTTASWVKTEGTGLQQYGQSVACAGDVNGDGFSDIIVGAWMGNSFKGMAYVYFGSMTGLATSFSWSKTENMAGAYFGFSVDGAGDVNGDGYSDIIIGAWNESSGAGKVYVYYGSTTGPALSSSWSKAGGLSANYGYSVSCAGDVNGDGYSDVAISSYNSTSANGSACVYYGSSSGLSATPAWSIAGISGIGYGACVASAGDVNGDGYSDIIVGAERYNSSAGKGYLYYGNNAGGLRNNLQQYKPCTANILSPEGLAGIDGQVRFSEYGKNFLGRTKGRLVFEYEPNGSPFSSGSNITNSVNKSGVQSSFTDLGLIGIQLTQDVSAILINKDYKWRSRIQYDPVTSITGQVYSPWNYYSNFGMQAGAFKAQVLPLPVKLLSFAARLDNEHKSVILHWVTASEINNNFFSIEKSHGGFDFSEIGKVDGNGNSNVIINYDFTDNYYWPGISYYRLKQVDYNGAFEYSNIVDINYPTEIGFKIYPDPVTSHILNFQNKLSESSILELLNTQGQIIVSEYVSSETMQVQLPTSVKPGLYYVILKPVSGGRYLEKIIIE